MFNLPAPPGFRGIDENLPLTVYHRHLPHWRGATYFVTFRLDDALPQVVVKQFQEQKRIWELNHPEPRSQHDWEQFSREIVVKSEKCLDEGHGACHFRNPAFAKLLAGALVHFNGARYATSCYVVMPNHCHVVVRPFPGFDLETILQGIKGFVARKVNLALGHLGTIWQEESYDRIIRDAEHLYRVIQYIGRNPELACIERSQWVRWIDPAWQQLGWNFEANVA